MALTEYAVLHRERILMACLSGDIARGGYWCRKHGTLYTDMSGCSCFDSTRGEYLDEDELIHALLQVILTGVLNNGYEGIN